jgi:hypothetical protein
MAKRVPVEYIERRVLEIRSVKVILGPDLAELYGVTTRRLNEQVRRNQNRFPEDFAFELTQEEKGEVVAKCDHLANLRFSPHLPLAFTEHGAIMAANVLNSEQATEMSVFVVRAFVKLRGILSSQVEMLRKLEKLEDKVGEHDEALRSIVEAIRQLMAAPAKTPQIGFDADNQNDE